MRARPLAHRFVGLVGHAVAVPAALPPDLAEIADIQAGVVTASQAVASGLSEELLRSRVGQGRWQRIHRGVYATFSGELSRRAQLWAAVLSAGPGAMLSHRSAAELQGLTDEPSQVIHVTVPTKRRVRGSTADVVIHRSGRAARVAHPAATPPRTKVEETILDLVEATRSKDEAVGWITRGLGRRLTTADRLGSALAGRSRIRWRAVLTELLSQDLAGTQSVLEWRYVRDVERPHHLPAAERQASFRQGGRSGYRDALYRRFGLAVELDGRLAHPAEQKWRDARRDNIAAAGGITTLRFGWQDVTTRPCEVAAQVAAVLSRGGFTGARPCSPTCPVGRSAASAQGA
jgi:Transcriptional regulator, AbiEi antitoxin